MQIVGTQDQVPMDHTFTASLRELAAPDPTSATMMGAPLVVLGGGSPATCPPLQVSSTGAVLVGGDIVVDGQCTGPAVGGDSSVLQPTGTTATVPDGLDDPLAGLLGPATSCSSGGPNPSPLGSSPAPDALVVHPAAVTISGSVTFEPGRYVFCQGLTLAPGANVTGQGVTIIVESGALTVSNGSIVDVSAPTSGSLVGIVAWVRSTTAARIELGSASGLRGTVYAPDADLVVSTSDSASIGGIVARSVGLEGSGTLRLGLPIATIVIDPVAVDGGERGVAFPAVTFTASGGTAPYTWTATGLPSGLTMSADGVLGGTPTVGGSFDVLVRTTDDDGVGASVTIAVEIGSGPSIDAPLALPAGEVGELFTPTTFTASAGTDPYTWSATGVPAGMSLSAAGVLSGTPTTPGQSTIVVTATDANGASGLRTYTLDIAAVFGISGPEALPGGQVGAAYTPTTMSATAGTLPYLWSATGLPPGLAMSFDGDLTGTPTTAGTYAIVVYSSDGDGTFATRQYSMTIVPPPPPAPAGCPETAEWRGEYYSNTTLSGAPALCRNDPSIDFDWNGSAPGVGVPGTDFSARWTRTVTFSAGTYQFVLGSDDGTRLYIDGNLVADDWAPRPYATRVLMQTIAGGPHTIVMEYFQGPGQSRATLGWTELVPATCPATAEGWVGEYFANRTLSGPALICRDDAAVDFDWGQASPGAPLGNDDFSARWTRTETFAAGTYVFTAGSDDGSRLYIDGVLVGDWWYDSSYATRTVTRTLTAGEHTVVMEYYERGGDARARLVW
jgi:hypothetical protein